MENITITIETILAFFGGIVCISGGVSAMIKLFNPFKRLKAQVEEHEDKLQNDFRKFENLNSDMKEIEKSNRIICKSLLVIMNHDITGNGIDKLKEQKDKMEQFLVDK